MQEYIHSISLSPTMSLFPSISFFVQPATEFLETYPFFTTVCVCVYVCVCVPLNSRYVIALRLAASQSSQLT